MERRGEESERGDMNREASDANQVIEQNEVLLAERDRLDKAIEVERERISSPPADPEDALERMREAAEPFREAIATEGAVPNIENDGLTWWQRLGMRLAEKARNFAMAIAEKARILLADHASRNKTTSQSTTTGGLTDEQRRGKNRNRRGYGAGARRREPARPEPQQRPADNAVPSHARPHLLAIRGSGTSAAPAYPLRDTSPRIFRLTAHC